MESNVSSAPEPSARREQNHGQDARATTQRAWLVALCLAVLLAIGFGLRVYDLGAADLTEDEELSTGLPLLGYGDLFNAIAGRPPLSFVVQKIFVELSGSTSPFMLRLPAVLEGVAGIAVFFGLMRAVGGNALGLLAAAMLTFSHFHIVWSRDGRYYPLLFLMSVICLWGLWEAAHRRSIGGVVACALGMAGAAMTHFSGYLFAASVFCVLPFVALMEPWRAIIRQHPRRIAIGAGVAVLAAAPFLWVMRDYVALVTRHIALPDFSRPLSPLFDVSPGFLYQRFGELIGMSGLGLFFAAIGLMGAINRRWLWLVFSAAVLLVPYVLWFLFPPNHAWASKYFIFQLPLFLGNLALFCVWSTSSTRKPKWSSFDVVIPFLVVALYINSNVFKIHATHKHPDQSQQKLGADLKAWASESEPVFYTWDVRPRVLRHAYAPIEDPNRAAVLRPGVPFPWSLTQSGSWYIFDGKTDAPQEIAAELLSGRYGRTVYNEMFLCRSPNAQQVVFGASAAGSPTPERSLNLAPGESHALDLLVPREGERALLLSVRRDASALPAEVTVTTPDGSKLRYAATEEVRDNAFAGTHLLTRGLQRFTITNTGEASLALRELAWVPMLDDTMPAWDFHSLTGDVLASVWPEVYGDETLLRDMRRGQVVSYRFYCDTEREVSVKVAGLNDAPDANRYQLHIPHTALSYRVMEFDREDDQVRWEETTPFVLPAGAHTLSIGYIGQTQEEFKKATRNGRAYTELTLQNSGLEAIRIQAE